MGTQLQEYEYGVKLTTSLAREACATELLSDLDHVATLIEASPQMWLRAWELVVAVAHQYHTLKDEFNYREILNCTEALRGVLVEKHGDSWPRTL